MSNPGIHDPYWYESYVGLTKIVEMLNPDSGISCVIFQHNDYDTIDDVVVEYSDGKKQTCYQVKHKIETSQANNITFGKMIEHKKGKKCLFEAMYIGWKQAIETTGMSIKPVLFSNRVVTRRRARRNFNGQKYSAYPVDEFISKMQMVISKSDSNKPIVIDDNDLYCQWKELLYNISIVKTGELYSFIMDFTIEANQLDLEELKKSIIAKLAQIFSCNENIAIELFRRLLYGLSKWTIAGRESQKVMLEDVYSYLSIESDFDDSQHRLTPPYPFFESRKAFCNDLEKQMKECNEKIVFLSGDPGSGKTSTISYIQAETDIFLLRFHTFKPISPEQHLYNTDPGMCTAENLWGTFLIQLRQKFMGRIAECNVPISNKLLTIDGMRSHVLRLIGLLATENNSKDKIFICIDGLDHAARSNANMSFLNTLPNPSEIPNGVCFVIVGQPIRMYQNQYPVWLTTGTGVKQIDMPKLQKDDIRQLLFEKAKQFTDNIDGLSKLIFDKTEGNNLSTVFAVEEIKTLETVDEVVNTLDKRNIGADIQQYYSYIWKHMKKELSNILLETVYPESIVACPLLLMSGRINTNILTNAIQNGLSEIDWKMILNNLYPLVVRTEIDGEYALFHNDFRVFLMGIISQYQERYEEIALQLAEYLLQNNVGMRTFVLGIPLLQIAKHEELIPKYFNEKYIIDALAEGVSKQRLDEYAHLSYKVSCDTQNLEGYLNTYFAIKTLYQHQRYFEFYDKTYFEKDFPELNTIDISEIRTLPIDKNNIDEYSRVLDLCKKLLKSKNPEHKERALILYDRWYGNCTPCSFLKVCKDEIQEEIAWQLRTNHIGILLQHWGEVAADLGVNIPLIANNNSKLESYSIFIFGDQYFTKSIDNEQYDLSIDALTKGYVSIQGFINHMETIYYSGKAHLFKSELECLKKYDDELEWVLLAHTIQTILDSNYIPEQAVLDSVQKITRIYDQSSYCLILNSFLIGRINKDFDDQELLNLVDDICSDINEKTYKKEEAIYYARTAILLGKYYWLETPTSEKFYGYVCWFLNAKVLRSIDYSKAYSFLLYTLLQSKACETLYNDADFLEGLQYALFEVNLLGMFYKNHILDYLIKHERLDIVDKYILELYGENCSRMCLEEDKADMHKRFEKYGIIVEPKLMQDFSKQLKWDLVGYVNHKEYAMHAPLELFEIIAEEHPERWKDLGSCIYNQSILAGNNNDVAYDINYSIEKASIKCGVDSYCELRSWNDDFRLNPNYIYNMIISGIETINDINDLKSLWILNCGIHSWYTQEEQNGAKNVYNVCCKKALDLDFDFSEYVQETTPQWLNIINHLTFKGPSKIEIDKHSEKYLLEQKVLMNEYEKLSIDEAISLLSSTPSRYYFARQFNVVYKKVTSNEQVSHDALESLLRIACDYLGEKEWLYSECDSIVDALLSKLGKEAFWKIATSLEANLSDYDYQTSSNNIQVLLKLAYKFTPEIIENIFIREIQTQKLWINGNGHLNINIEEKIGSCYEMQITKSIPDLTLMILLEQIDTQNARKIEAAVYALYLLGKELPATIDAVVDKWQNYSRNQKKWLMIIISRWVIDNLCSEKLRKHLEKIYSECIELSEKYYLHSVLIRLDTDRYNCITYEASGNELQFPTTGATANDSYYENFINLLDQYDLNGLANKIRWYILQIERLENYIDDPYGESGDSRIPVVNSQIEEPLYSLEQSGCLDSIPLQEKKSCLLFPEDPFILTELPYITFDNNWFPNISTRYNTEENYGLSIEQMRNIVHSNVSETDIVLAASLWYPWGHNDGAVYIESTTISSESCEIEDETFDWCLGNYSLLITEGNLEETSNLPSLFNRVVGTQSILFGNCQLIPSSIWRDLFNCEPVANNPLNWINKEGNVVLSYERIASPFREALQEAYIRQPILFRWVCNKEWINGTLSKLNVHLARVFYKFDYPNFE